MSARKVEQDTVVRHPMASALTTIGLGLVIGYAFYEMLKPRPTPAQRTARAR